VTAWALTDTGVIRKRAGQGRFARLIAVPTAAALCGTHRNAVYHAIRRGHLPVIERVYYRRRRDGAVWRRRLFLIPEEAALAWRDATIAYWLEHGKPGPKGNRRPTASAANSRV
jgi:hypothetical protein